MALLAVGDIHGNVRALDSLLERITPELSNNDTLVFLGDYIDRGPHVRECVDRIVALREAATFIASYSNRAVEVLRRAIERGGISLILGKSELPYEVFFDAMPPKHLQFFQTLQRYHFSDGVLCVHGGIDTDTFEIAAQHPDSFLWGCETFPDSYSREEHIVYGHHSNAVFDGDRWPHPNLKTNRTYGIDTIAHGVLTAIRFPGGDVFQSRRFTL